MWNRLGLVNEILSIAGCSAIHRKSSSLQSSMYGSRRTAFDFPPVNVEHAYDCIDVMRNIAQRKNASVAQIAIAWLLHQKAVTSVIIGAKRTEQLEDNIAATTIKLNDDDLAALGKVSALPSEYPGWMFALQGENRRKQLAESVDLPGMVETAAIK